MKKIFTTVLLICVSVVSALAVTVNEAVGVFQGDLNIGGQEYPDKEVYLLPGTVKNTLTFVLPDFTFGAKGKLGNIVLPNIPMSAEGQLTLENARHSLSRLYQRTRHYHHPQRLRGCGDRLQLHRLA